MRIFILLKLKNFMYILAQREGGRSRPDKDVLTRLCVFRSLEPKDHYNLKEDVLQLQVFQLPGLLPLVIFPVNYNRVLILKRMKLRLRR